MKFKKSILSFTLVLAFLLITTVSPFPTKAETWGDLGTFTTDESTGWTVLDEEDKYPAHLATKYTTYKYSSSSVKQLYSAYVNAGIAMWGSNISFTEGSGTTTGTIIVDNYHPTATATTIVPNNLSGDFHTTNWIIIIHLNNFNACSTAEKNRAIAHEIGHVYGLGHVDNSFQIMYWQTSSTKSVTAADLRGLKLMTHEHTHNGTNQLKYIPTSDFVHDVRCAVCYAIFSKSVICSHTDMHSGNRHYYTTECVCGNNKTLSWACKGNPCILPFSYKPPVEVQ